MTAARTRRQLRLYFGSYFLGHAVATVGVALNLVERSGWPHPVSLLLIVFGLMLGYGGPLAILSTIHREQNELLNAVAAVLGSELPSGELPPGEREALLARLNRTVGDYPNLTEFVAKVVVPVTVALFALIGVALTVISKGPPLNESRDVE